MKNVSLPDNRMPLFLGHAIIRQRSNV